MTPGLSAGCSGTPGTTTRPARCGRKRPQGLSETFARTLTDPHRGFIVCLLRRRRSARSQRARALHDPGVPQDRLPRGALDSHAGELPARPRDALRHALPAGTTPGVLTFDDSSPGQFRYLEKDGTLEIDPKCGVGILEAFIKERPDFGRGGTSYVLPGASKPNRLFNQPALEGKKLQFLAKNGYEIGNHTLWHANLAKYPEPTVRAQVAEAQVWIQRHVPDYKTRTLALPHGSYPSEVNWVLRGPARGTPYSHEAVLMVAGGAAPSPFSRAFDPVRLPRIQAVERDLTYWLNYFDKTPGERFVSDGDPNSVTVPSARRDKLRDELRSLR